MRRYTLAQLEAFLAISRLGTFRAAAEQLHITQPSISLRIAELESAIGKALFVKRGRNAVLTQDGLMLMRYAERGLGLFNEMDEILAGVDAFKGRLRLGAVDTIAMTCLPEVVRAIEDAYPLLEIELTIASNHTLMQSLKQKKLDLAFALEPHLFQNQWSEKLGQVDIAWLSSAKNSLAQKTLLRPHDLANEHILTRTPPSRLNGIISNWFASEKVPAPNFNLCSNIAVIARFIISDLAVSVLPVCVLQHELETGAVVRYKQHPELKPLSLYIVGAVASRSPRSDDMVSIIRRVLSQAGIFSS